MNINIVRFAAVMSIALCCGEALAGRELARNPPSACSGPGNRCGCPEKKVTAKCIKATVDLGETTPWTGSLECSLKIFADDDSPSIFTADSLYAVLGGYAFKRLGTQNLSDGATPAEVVFSHPNGEPVHFVFAEGESLGRPDPGVHIKMDERLMMVDAEGWATTSNPVYYDLYIGDGSRRRFLATNMTGALGQLVSIVDARGITTTPADMGVDIVYDSNGVRQYLTPSRLANVTHTAGFTGYDVRVYALQEVPAKDAQTGLYAVPAAQPAERLSIRRENDGKRAIVTVQKGAGEEQRYVFDYAMGEWSLTRPSGAKELRERYIVDERDAKIVTSFVSATGDKLEHVEYNYKWESWGFAMTNRVEGFGDVTATTEWTYYTSGNGKGQVKTEKRQSGLLTQYTYDSVDRVISETRSGPGMMTEVTTYDYTPVDPSDPVLPVDTRPRTVVRKLNNIECERTYYVYSPLTNIVERVGTQGAAYGGTNVLRTVTAFYPVVANDPRSGFVASIRHEDGKLDHYDYDLSSNTWIRTITHLHEQSPAPVSGKTTRDIAVANARGEEIEARTEAYIDGIWYTIARNRMTYNAEGKRTSLENLAGQVTTTAWDCCHKVSETGPDGSTTTWDYDDEGRVIASSRLIPLDMTNVTWLTTCYEYDALGRQTATWQTNFAAHVGLPVERTRYDQLGRVIARIDQLGNTTTTSFSNNGRVQSVTNPNTSTVVYARNANGDTLSITGTAVTPEFHTYGISNLCVAATSSSPIPCRVYETRIGSADSPRFTKRYENLLGQTVREERSGFQGAVLATTHTYDSLGRLVSTAADYEPTTAHTYDTLGNRIATTRSVTTGTTGVSPVASGTTNQSPAGTGTTGVSPVEWRKTETTSSFVSFDDIIWLTQTNIVSCSDSAIAPLVSSSARQLAGLTAALPARSRSFDIRGNVTENEMLVDSSFVTSRQTLPYATNKPLSFSRYGVNVMEVSVSAVTNTVAYDALGRQIATTDGRGNTRHIEYNSFGQRVVSIDALGNRTTYSYDQFGNLTSVTDPLGNATIYEYNLRGNKVLEYGATYPVRYTYDIFGNKTSMTTFREGFVPDASASGDTTTWLYDIASGSMTNKVYADGKGPSYTYTPDGKLAQRTWARGIVTTYAYDGWNQLVSMTYSDDTPSVTYAYDALGRPVSATDAAGTTTTAYDAYGDVASEATVGLYSKTLTRHCDAYGRDLGYTLDNSRKNVIEYEEDTGRIKRVMFAGAWYTYGYLPGTDLKSSLTVGTAGRTDWMYEPNRDLLTQVKNTAFGSVVSQYDYVSDALGRRTEIARSGSRMTESRSDAYGYNDRSELTNAVKNATLNEYAYQYDDIGNRLASLDLGDSRVYQANSLNQYTSISNAASTAEAFVPQFDLDGNQTLVRTTTGDWTVSYNGENRPVSWSCGATNIVMSFDRMGRRVEYLETTSAEESVISDGETNLVVTVTTNAHHRFVYDGYLCIQRLNAAANNAVDLAFGWDPTEPVATRPLWMQRPAGSYNFFYFHDGNKNVSDLVSYQSARGVPAHYEYAPFGAVTAATTNTSFTAFNVAETNPFRFSSEYADDALGLVYYNYRHYEPVTGRWMCRDPYFADETEVFLRFCDNSPVSLFDLLGLWSSKWPFDDHGKFTKKAFNNFKKEFSFSCDVKNNEKRVFDAVLQKIIGANRSTDSKNEFFNNMHYHYNRGLDESPMAAKALYVLTWIKELTEIGSALTSSPRRCDEALEHLGIMSHMWQDYFAHGIDPSSKDCVGTIRGTPMVPLAVPSSYGSASKGGEHGGVGCALGQLFCCRGVTPEPGDRASDKATRQNLSVEYTEKLFNVILPIWFKKCGCEYCKDK